MIEFESYRTEPGGKPVPSKIDVISWPGVPDYVAFGVSTEGHWLWMWVPTSAARELVRRLMDAISESEAALLPPETI